MIGGIPGYMGPPPLDPTPIQPQGGNTSTGGYPAGGNTVVGGGNGGGRGMAFNPSGGINTYPGYPGPPMVSMPYPGGGPTYAGGGPGWMPPPPIGPPGIGVYPTDSGGGNPTPVGRGYPGYPARPQGWAPQRMPVVQPQIPGWAGYLQWLQMMGGGRMPPPPIQGI